VELARLSHGLAVTPVQSNHVLRGKICSGVKRTRSQMYFSKVMSTPQKMILK